MNKSSVFLHTKVYVSSDCVLFLGKMNENPQSNIVWEDRLTWFKSSPEYRAFEWNIFPGFTTLQLCHKVQELLSRLSVTPKKFTGRIIFMSRFNDISWGSKDNKKECKSNAQLVSLFARRFGAGQWSFLGLGSENKWYSISEDSPQGEWDRVAELMMLKFGESGHPVFRATSPLSRAQKQRRWKIVDPLLCRPGNDYNCCSHNHFCKSAQSFRSSRRNV